MLGSLSRIQDDIERSRSLYFKALSAVATVTMPFMALLLIAGPMVIDFLYGEDWAGASGPLQVMVIGGVFVMLSLTLRALVNAQGLVKQLVPVNVVALLFTVAVVLGLSPLGLVAVAIGISVREVLLFVGMARILRNSRIALRLTEVGYALYPPLIGFVASLVGGGVAAGYGRSVGFDEGFVLVMIATAGTFGGYGIAMVILMAVLSRHPPLMSTRSLLIEGLQSFLKRLPLRRSMA
jgi:O-antigen/teichoic acid export membrane protein